MSRKPEQPDPRVIILDELTLTIKISPTLDRKVVDALVARISGEGGGSFAKEITNYLKAQLIYGVCGKTDVLVESSPPIQSL